MIAIDTNILIYSHREDSAWHKAADRIVSDIAESSSPWAIPWPCLHEFIAIVTHPRIYDPFTPMKDALIQVDCWLESPSLYLLNELPDYWQVLKRSILGSKIVGPAVHDARIAAICEQHGVTKLYSADRDFGRFGSLKVENPLLWSGL